MSDNFFFSTALANPGQLKRNTEEQGSNFHEVFNKSEWVFSVTGRIVTAQRANLSPEKVVIVNSDCSIIREMGM